MLGANQDPTKIRLRAEFGYCGRGEFPHHIPPYGSFSCRLRILPRLASSMPFRMCCEKRSCAVFFRQSTLARLAAEVGFGVNHHSCETFERAPSQPAWIKSASTWLRGLRFPVSLLARPRNNFGARLLCLASARQASPSHSPSYFWVAPRECFAPDNRKSRRALINEQRDGSRKSHSPSLLDQIEIGRVEFSVGFQTFRVEDSDDIPLPRNVPRRTKVP